MANFKNIEEVWAYAKRVLPQGVSISNIQKSPSLKVFDIEIPKTLLKKFPPDTKNNDLSYTVTGDAMGIELFLEQNGMETSIVDKKDFYDCITTYLGLPLVENEIISVEKSPTPEWDNVITFEYYSSRDILEKKLKKSNLPYMLQVLPSDEAELYCKNMDVTRFKNFIKSLNEDNKMKQQKLTQQEHYYLQKLIKGEQLLEMQLLIASQALRKIQKNLDMQMSIAESQQCQLTQAEQQAIQKCMQGQQLTQQEQKLAQQGQQKLQQQLQQPQKVNEAGSDYQEFFRKKLEQYNVSSPSELSQEDRSKFFSEIKSEWKQQKTNESQQCQLTQAEQQAVQKCMQGQQLTQQEQKLAQQGQQKLAQQLQGQQVNEAFTARKLSGDMLSDFSSKEIDFIKNALGSSDFYQVYKGKNLAAADKLADKSQPGKTERIEGFVYEEFTSPKGMKFVYANGGSILGEFYIFPVAKINESEHMQGTGKLYYTDEEVGTLSDDALKTALETLGTEMSKVSQDPTEDSVKAYEELSASYNGLKAEYERRGLTY